MQFLLNRSNRDYKPQVAVFTLILAVLSLDSNSIGGRTQAVAMRECDRSKSGRVVSEGDLYLPPGSQLCTGDQINPSNGSTVKVLCYLNRNFLSLKHSTIFNPEICASLKDEVKRCSVENVDKCLRRFKSPNHNYYKPKVISPYGNSILNTRPVISWYPVAGADRYTVIVEGNDVKWRTEVKNATLLYPKDQRQLKYGNAYTITVIANKGNSYINDDTTVVNVLPQYSGQF
ncbi:hypothetical protein FNW02_36815 [Komarekiella sp. 'clone 1']|uniref:Uncharacterized protein n=1 Tax=Komarekiella delphini-convector SJRDD-AB1 TaxID=2593771 RepID=A0AA40VVM5_9NOST|nr:hypothetical protein [Komarekiella delphini-convector]MBD6621127.1 hypothetical protein [Komarekiella delphini-convector SJRDD-AB1]